MTPSNETTKYKAPAQLHYNPNGAHIAMHHGSSLRGIRRIAERRSKWQFRRDLRAKLRKPTPPSARRFTSGTRRTAPNVPAELQAHVRPPKRGLFGRVRDFVARLMGRGRDRQTGG